VIFAEAMAQRHDRPLIRVVHGGRCLKGGGRARQRRPFAIMIRFHHGRDRSAAKASSLSARLANAAIAASAGARSAARSARLRPPPRGCRSSL
jgi:hypothetical protein